MNQHLKRPVQRAFTGLAGSPLSGSSVVEEQTPKRRGRPPRYKNDEERKAADAQRKRNERIVETAEKIITEHPDHRGSHGESSGGYDSEKISKVVGAQQSAEAVGLGTNRDPDAPELDTPDRRRNSVVPVNPDDAADKEETDSTFMNNALRRQARSLRKWIRGAQKRACRQDHAKLAERQMDSKTKVYCGSCGKLLVSPGKTVKGIFPDTLPDVAN